MPVDKLAKTKYSMLDILNICLGRTNYIEWDNYKGFNYDHFIYDVKNFFDIVEISPFTKISFLTLYLGFGIVILEI